MAVSYWENAKKPVPKDRMARLREVLGPYLEEEVEARGVTQESPRDPSVKPVSHRKTLP